MTDHVGGDSAELRVEKRTQFFTIIILALNIILAVTAFFVVRTMNQYDDKFEKAHITHQHHEDRIDSLERFKAEGGRWTLLQQREYESDVQKQLTALLVGQEKIKAKLGVE